LDTKPTKPRRQGLKGDPARLISGMQQAHKSAKFITSVLHGLSAIIEPRAFPGPPNLYLAQGHNPRLRDEI